MTRLTRAQVREVDRLAIEELGIPAAVLMENAGGNAARAVLDVLRDRVQIDPARARVDVLCGGGNNGGDGYVIARHLHNAGVSVVAYACREASALSGECAVNHVIADRIGLVRPLSNGEMLRHWPDPAREPCVVVDALLGTGFTGRVRGHVAGVIDRCNAVHRKGVIVVAVDLPSGLDCDTGVPGGAAIEADVTVTFVAEKVGFASAVAGRYLGRVMVVGIGAPPTLIERVNPVKGTV
ncbi:MAG: NAD(P)H-hydrate epimerase [Planctomycetes bacterium]|nr:NAD(P)H-hydrate epimerase [Planctomycetota bacterium]